MRAFVCVFVHAMLFARGRWCMYVYNIHLRCFFFSPLCVRVCRRVSVVNLLPYTEEEGKAKRAAIMSWPVEWRACMCPPIITLYIYIYVYTYIYECRHISTYVVCVRLNDETVLWSVHAVCTFVSFHSYSRCGASMFFFSSLFFSSRLLHVSRFVCPRVDVAATTMSALCVVWRMLCFYVCRLFC